MVNSVFRIYLRISYNVPIHINVDIYIKYYILKYAFELMSKKQHGNFFYKLNTTNILNALNY